MIAFKCANQILGTNVGYFVENTTVDLNERRLELRSENLTFANVLRLQERCVYVPAQEDSVNATLFTHSASGELIRRKNNDRALTLVRAH
jgi:hypothetical protein